MKHATFWVFLGNTHIDTVFCDADMTAEDVQSSLVNRDGYDSRIQVIRERNTPIPATSSVSCSHGKGFNCRVCWPPVDYSKTPTPRAYTTR